MPLECLNYHRPAPVARCKCDNCYLARDSDRDRRHKRKADYERRFPGRFLQQQYASQKKRIAEMRREIITHYGSKCRCCDESIYGFLTIQHKNNDGSKERQKIGTIQVLRKIINTGFPDSYEILCFNCNLSLGFNGYCPHERNASK